MDLTVFDHFPEPIVYLRAGQIGYSNPAARALEPEWTAGAPIPPALDIEPDREGVFSCLAGGQPFQASATRTEDGLLLTLRHPVGLPTGEVLTTLPIQLREQTQNILSAAKLLLPLTEEDETPQNRVHIHMLQQSFHRLFRLARHLELAQQAQSDDFPLCTDQAVDLAQLCRETSYGAAKLAELAGITFQDDIPGGILITAGNPEWLEIMLLELISNAIKAAGTGGQAGLTLSSTGSRALITVWDNGQGMDQADLSATLDGASPESLPKPGTGLRLGLSIARHAAAAHGGAILLESQPGQGMRVTVSLPLNKPPKSPLRTPRVTAEESVSPLLTLLSDALPLQAFEE